MLFFHGEVKETVFVSQPPGFKNAVYPSHVCKLKKVFYGLTHSLRLIASVHFLSLKVFIQVVQILHYLFLNRMKIWSSSYYVLTSC